MIFRSIAALALACALLAPLAAAQAQPVTWEYAALVVESTGQALWMSPDGNVEGLTLAVVTRDVREMYGPYDDTSTRGTLRLLNAVGAGGWELVEVSASEYLFKRRAE